MNLRVRRHLAANSRPGQLLPGKPATEQESVRYLAHLLSLSNEHVQAALRWLDGRGDVALIPNRGVLVLGPEQPHPDDTGITGLIRRRIEAGVYRPGQPLALELLALRFRVPSHQVRRACRPLIRASLLHSRPHGPYGPGIYVRTTRTAPSITAPQAVTEAR
ncbi:GntR family transcriptional regulator [Streptomyces sp. 3211.6]|uniref:GntR family transcriptional regulator n=1 Tax=Streptomyces sp. 3211.6 TaxID=1938845 RepID=UPI00165196EC|nr:GntR family transcriptional regulator [Streptomyces sp. 3211.6]